MPFASVLLGWQHSPDGPVYTCYILTPPVSAINHLVGVIKR